MNPYTKEPGNRSFSAKGFSAQSLSDGVLLTHFLTEKASTQALVLNSKKYGRLPMILGKVIRTIWATQKEESLAGHRLVVVSPVSKDGVVGNEILVAVDQLGAGSGDLVLVVQGYPASRYFKNKAPIDAVVVALVDLSQGESP